MARIPWRLASIVIVGLGALVGCAGGDGNGGLGPNPGTIAISVSPGALSLVQGQSGQVTVALTRGGSFTGAVNVSVQGAPAGVTIAGATVAAGSSSAQLTVTASASAAVGQATVIINATGSGVTAATAAMTLTTLVSAENGYDPSISVSSFDLEQGASQSLTIEVNRTNGFAGTVTFSTSNLPAGITATFDPASVTGSQTTLTVEADVALAPGDYSFTVNADADDPGGAAAGPARASATVTKSFTVTVSIVASGGGTPSFTMGLSSSTLSILQGGTGSVTLDVVRSGGFTGAVDLALSGAPTGMTVTATPSTVTGNQSTVDVGVGAAVPPGDYVITITGMGTGVAAQTVDLTVNVTTSGGGGGGTVSFAFCEQSGLPLFVAAKNGHGGSWQALTPTGNTYTFDFGTVGGIVWVTDDGDGDFTTTQWFGNTALLDGLGAALCEGNGLTRTVTGTVAGLGQTDQATISMGGALATAGLGAGDNFTLMDVRDGLPVDMVIARTAFTGTSFATDRILIERDLDPAPGANLGVFDMNGGSSFAPVTGNITINNLGGDQALLTSFFYTADFASATLQGGLAPAGAVQQYVAVPASQRESDDLHLFSAGTVPSSTDPPIVSRSALLYVADPGASPTLTLGPAPSGITVSTVQTAPNALLRVQYTRQAEYNSQFTFGGSQSVGGKSRAFFAVLQPEYVGSGDVDFTMPDLNSIGYDPNWGLVAGSDVNMFFGVSGWSGGSPVTPFVDGGTVIAGTYSDVVVP